MFAVDLLVFVSDKILRRRTMFLTISDETTWLIYTASRDRVSIADCFSRIP